MLFRLLTGLIKGILIGGLVGYGLAAAGLSWGWLAYIMAAVSGILVALVAGKPIWSEGARIEVGMKAAAGALLGPGLLWLARSFLTMPLPFDPSQLPALSSLATKGLTLGTFSITALALVAAVLGAFYDADNQPKAADDSKSKAKGGAKKRIDAGTSSAAREAEAEAAEEDSAAEARTQRARRD
jgi:hypothetical protein